MKDYRFIDILGLMFGYMVFSLMFTGVTGSGLSIWLGINTFLALIPLLLITIIHFRLKKLDMKVEWLTIILFLTFVFFFPNSFYVITDLIHIDSGEFYTQELYSVEYLRDISAYMLIFHILITILIGIYAGVKSILRYEDIFKSLNVSNTIRSISVIVLVFLSSIGIYIGRFLRYFSWDILNPFKVIGGLIGDFDVFMVLFIIGFTVLQLLLYYSYKRFIGKEPF